MWIVRILSGPKAGENIPLRQKTTLVGRSPECAISLPSQGVSKNHAEFEIEGGKVIVHDLGSRNGTKVNGVRIKSRALNEGDKVIFHDIVVDLIEVPDHALVALQRNSANAQRPHPAQQQQGWAPQSEQGFSPQMSGLGDEEDLQSHVSPGKVTLDPKNLTGFLQNYFEKVVMPGVYRLVEVTEYKNVVLGFIIGLILVVSSLAIIPMIQISKASIEAESRRRALTIARNLARTNEAAILRNVDSSVSTQDAQLEEGVKRALVIAQNDGHIIAPARLSGEYPDEPFLHAARRQQKEVVQQIDSSTIGASVPISYYDSQTGNYTVKAHATVLYDMGAFAVDDGRAISLFVQTLALSLIAGALVFLFLYKLIEHPIRQLNQEIDKALRDQHDQLHFNFRFPLFQRLTDNVNTLLTRALEGQQSDQPAAVHVDRESEAHNLMQLVGLPSVVIDGTDETIILMNAEFERLTYIDFNQIRRQPIESISDQALQLNLRGLVDQCRNNPLMVASDQIDFSGDNYEILAQAIHGNAGVAYYIIVVQPPATEEAGFYEGESG